MILAAIGSAQETTVQVRDNAPSSIGFANPDSTQPVRAYRLPTWHSSMWTLQETGLPWLQGRSGTEMPTVEAKQKDHVVIVGFGPACCSVAGKPMGTLGFRRRTI